MADKVNHAEAVDIIEAMSPTDWVRLIGPVGCGKSSILKTLAKRNPEYVPIHLDVPTMDFPDFYMPSVDKEKQESMLYLNRTFGKNDPRPKIYLYDEWDKAMESVKKMTLQQLLHLDFNGWTPPEGTMRFSTGNLNSEGVGDTIQAHAMNRNIEIEIGKPTVSEMEKYALDNGWTQEILVLLREVPECLDDYRDMDDAQITAEEERMKQNPYIHDPRVHKGQFVTPRSLERGNRIISKLRNHRESMFKACTGNWGSAFTEKFRTILQTSDELPAWQDIMDNPDTAKLPESGIGETILVTKAQHQVKSSDAMTKWMTYLNRIESLETQCMFATLMYRMKEKQNIAMHNQLFSKWAKANRWVYAADKR